MQIGLMMPNKHHVQGQGGNLFEDISAAKETDSSKEHQDIGT